MEPEQDSASIRYSATWGCNYAKLRSCWLAAAADCFDNPDMCSTTKLCLPAYLHFGWWDDAPRMRQSKVVSDLMLEYVEVTHKISPAATQHTGPSSWHKQGQRQHVKLLTCHVANCMMHINASCLREYLLT
jgi:hypothetical protein